MAEGVNVRLTGPLQEFVRQKSDPEKGLFSSASEYIRDLIGQDVNLAVTRSVYEANFYDKRYQPSLVQQALVDAGRLGRKTGRGVYSYDEDGQRIRV